MSQKVLRDDLGAPGETGPPASGAVSFVALLDEEAESLAQSGRFALHAAELSYHDHTSDGRPRQAKLRR